MDSRLSPPMRDVLIDHLDGGACRYLVPANVSGKVSRQLWAKKRSLVKLLRLGFLEWTDRSHKFTVITEAGRGALAGLLGEYADALLRAGLAGDGGGNDQHIRRGKLISANETTKEVRCAS
jgi:hypothetical protein